MLTAGELARLYLTQVRALIAELAGYEQTQSETQANSPAAAELAGAGGVVGALKTSCVLLLYNAIIAVEKDSAAFSALEGQPFVSVIRALYGSLSSYPRRKGPLSRPLSRESGKRPPSALIASDGELQDPPRWFSQNAASFQDIADEFARFLDSSGELSQEY